MKKRADSSSSTSVDPFVFRQQAEVAAVEAYQRAQLSHERGASQSSLQRSRSQRVGRTEGSHFDDARFGRRQSQKTDGSKAKRGRARILAGLSNERAVARRSPFLPSKPDSNEYWTGSSPPRPLEDALRKRASGYTEGSPEPRHTHTSRLRDSSLSYQRDPDRSRTTDTEISNLPQHVRPDYITGQNLQSTTILVGEKTAANADLVAQARDKCLHGFQHAKLRERRSFLLAPFQHRRLTDLAKPPVHDYSLPPFNYADDPDVDLSVGLSQSPATRGQQETEVKARKISDSLKGRLRRAFRRTSKPVSAKIPPQHIEAKDFRWTIRDCDVTQGTYASDKIPDPVFEIASEQTSVPKPKLGGVSSYDGFRTCKVNSARSRVTSWTDSSLADTSTVRSRVGPTVTQEEDASTSSLQRVPGLANRSSNATLRVRKVSSFFGRPKSALHRASNADLQSSSECRGLYDALQKRLYPSEPVRLPSEQQDTESHLTQDLQTISEAGNITPDGRVSSRRTGGVLSPTSIYSRATDGHVDRPESPEDVRNVIVTGCEVKRYSLLQPRGVQVPKPSADWRRWLSDEFSIFGLGLRNASCSNGIEHASQPSEGKAGITAAPCSDKIQPKPTSTTPGTICPLFQPLACPHIESRSPSYMNERYPMVSNGELTSQTTTSSRSQSRIDSHIADSGGRHPRTRKHTALPPIRGKPVVRDFSNSRSTDETRNAAETPSNAASGHDAAKDFVDKPNSVVAQPVVRAGEARRPKSAYELRVKYKNGAGGIFKPLEIRRKKTQTFTDVEETQGPVPMALDQPSYEVPQRIDARTSLLATLASENLNPGPVPLTFRLEEDPTLINISAGPYAKQFESDETVVTPLQHCHPLRSMQHSSSPRLGQLNMKSTPIQYSRNQQRENQPPAENLSGSKWQEDGQKRVPPSTTGSVLDHRASQRSPGQRLVTNWLDERGTRWPVKKQSMPSFL